MSTRTDRLELFIDVFDHAQQRALALPTLNPRTLIAAILQEFRELEFLSANPAEYQLVQAADQTPLQEEQPLAKQVSNGQHLRLLERELSLPKGGEPPPLPLYLRDTATNKVFKVHWLPAIIGRLDPQVRDNELVAVNLEEYPTGLCVSRRHARIIRENGQLLLVSISSNPTALITNQGPKPVTQPQPLQSGDVIHLERSDISLKVIMRA